MKKILLIVGSLRKSSFNRQLAGEAAALLEGRANVKTLDFDSVPFMNQDREYPAPESVARVRTEVGSADAVWIFTPEYNYSYPGVLKNLLDWLSRPLKEGDPDRVSALTGKKAAISSAAGSSAGAGARAKLGELLVACRADVMKDPQTEVKLDREAYTTDVLSLGEEERAQLAAQGDALLAYLEA